MFYLLVGDLGMCDVRQGVVDVGELGSDYLIIGVRSLCSYTSTKSSLTTSMALLSTDCCLPLLLLSVIFVRIG
jgi:hypothetical protein